MDFREMATEDVRAWLHDAQEFGWKLPPPAPWWLRLWGVRHIRALGCAYRVARHQAIWGALGLLSSGYDEWVLFAIARGWC